MLLWKGKIISNSANAQNFPNRRVILHNLKCNSAHLYQRLHFDTIKYTFHRPHGDGKRMKAWSSVLLKKEEKYELKKATRFKTLNIKSNLSDVQSTNLIATASFTCLWLNLLLLQSSLLTEQITVTVLRTVPSTAQSVISVPKFYPPAQQFSISPKLSTDWHMFLWHVTSSGRTSCHSFPYHQFLQISRILTGVFLEQLFILHSLGTLIFSWLFLISPSYLHFYSTSEPWILLFTGVPVQFPEFSSHTFNVVVPIPAVAWDRNSRSSSVTFKFPEEPDCGSDSTTFCVLTELEQMLLQDSLIQIPC